MCGCTIEESCEKHKPKKQITEEDRWLSVVEASNKVRKNLTSGVYGVSENTNSIKKQINNRS